MKSLLFTTTSSHVVPGACHHAQQKDQNERQGPVRFTFGNGKKHTPIIPLRSKTEESSLQNAHMHIICILVNLTGYDSQFLYTSSIYLSFWSHGDMYEIDVCFCIYHLVMTHSLPWKVTMLFSSVNHLFLWAIYTMAKPNSPPSYWMQTRNYPQSAAKW